MRSAQTTQRTTRYFLSFFVILVVVLGYRYYEYKIDRDYALEVYASCDPTVEQCFIADGPENEDVYNAEPYKKVRMVARFAPACLEEHTCKDFTCPVAGDSCAITYCSDESLSDGEICVSQETP